MRRFNYTGPVYADEHYIVKRREMYIDFKNKIDEGRYFTIFAPRQMGKTTFLKEIVRNINQDNYYIGINIDFERYRGIEIKHFYMELKIDIEEAFFRRLSEIGCVKKGELKKIFDHTSFGNHIEFYRFVKLIGEVIPEKKLVFLIDEFDAVSIDITGNFLYTLRDMYLKRREDRAFSIYSIGLVGVKNIRELNVGSASPFNIATQIKLDNFTLGQCHELIEQYIEETGQEFDNRVIEKIHFETNGHPFLVNRLCAILVEDISQDKNKPIKLGEFQQAIDMLLSEHNTNFDSLRNNAEKQKTAMQKLIFTDQFIEYNPYDNIYENLIMYGVIKKGQNNNTEIANPIYKKVLIKTFSPVTDQENFFANGVTPSKFLERDKINILLLLSNFKQFVERVGLKLFDIVQSQKESAGQYLLMSYLDLFIRSLDGYSIIETPSGRGRIDVLLHYKREKHVIELKMWRGKEYHEKGKMQLIEYLKSEGLKEGYMVLFDPRDKEFKDFDENQIFEDAIEGYKVVSFLINI